MKKKSGEFQASKATSPWRKFRLSVVSIFMILAGSALTVGPWIYMFSLIRDNSTSGMMAAGAVSWFAPYVSVAGILLIIPGFTLLIKVLRGRLPLTALEAFERNNPSLLVPSRIDARVWRATALIGIIGSLAVLVGTGLLLLRVNSSLLVPVIVATSGQILFSGWLFVQSLVAFSGSTNSYLALNRVLKIAGILAAFSVASFLGGVVVDFDGFINSMSENADTLGSLTRSVIFPLGAVAGWLVSQKLFKRWRSELPSAV